MDHVIKYIIRFLLGDDVSGNLVPAIGYTADRSLFHHYNIVIIPSGFFEEMYGHVDSLPRLPLQEIEGVPFLFGSSMLERIGDTIIVHADLIASTYFLITRYEEMIRREIRDEHGRFPGKESLPYRAGFIDRPVVDEYRLLIRGWLKETHIPVREIKQEVRKIYLTHDIDAPFLYRSRKGFIRSLLDGRGLISSIKGRWGAKDNDPYYTFPWIEELQLNLQKRVGKKKVQSIYFFKAGGRTKQDKPFYNLKGRDIQSLIRQAKALGAEIGLHSSYQAGLKPLLIAEEKKKLEEAREMRVHLNRHHFLACREPEDMLHLEAAGITDDFTMGYADVAGFRLGTTYPVRWINPVTRRLSPLTLHPLLIMDCTLDRYMGLNYDEAFEYGIKLINHVKHTGGELVLLWHNAVLSEDSGSYHRLLYMNILNELQ
ncbi:polysaccharide deacetylase family protein [Parabacteroides sp. PF5-9]|uniref:polysaccharide deacetylase family protein n=1 Tax=Parabacteroides sp. PF5-9 TaxID=1742404 RepID=UPI002476DD95|nr:polysaccharide deacetylase family protein [Parabacteroides sp. PF5-9]MDH6359067.1 hypothetical protein [Parabacteroides sp. PF5-9]